MPRIKNYLQNLILLSTGCILAILILEIFLRSYNPFGFTVKGDEIKLPLNRKLKIKISDSKTVVHTKNSLGFRGEEPRKSFRSDMTVIAVGGSTTECAYLDDTRTWPYLLEKKLSKRFKRLWLNNAGLDGHSTSGHIVLMSDYLSHIKPKMILFLVGVNEIETKDFRPGEEFIQDSLLTEKYDLSGIEKFFKSTAKYSEISSVLFNFYRYGKAVQRGLVHDYGYGYDPEYMTEKLEEREKDIARFYKEGSEHEEVDDDYSIQNFLKHEKYLNKYEHQLEKLCQISKANGIEPVLITQTSAPYRRMEGLKLYNEVTRKVAKREKVFLIDLAVEMPDNAQYYYDDIHYNEEGAEKVSEIIYRILHPYMKKKYHVYAL